MAAAEPATVRDLVATTRCPLGRWLVPTQVAVILDRDPGDISTVEDEDSVEEAREAWQQMRAAVGAGQAPV